MQWLSFSANEIQNGVCTTRLVRFFGMNFNYDEAAARARDALQLLESHLNGRKWLELNRPTIADIAMLPYVSVSHEGGIPLDEYPNIRGWIGRIKALPRFVPMPGMRGSNMQRALIVIDVQQEYFNGMLPISYPHDHLGNILRTMDAAARKGVPVVVVQHEFPKDKYPFFIKGTPQWELHPEVAQRPRGLHIEKSLPGSFTGTELEPWLRQRCIDRVTIAGYMSHMCDTTARQAMHRGLNVEFLSDATGTLAVENTAGKVSDEELHRSVLVSQQMLISTVLPSKGWIAGL